MRDISIENLLYVILNILLVLERKVFIEFTKLSCWA